MDPLAIFFLSIFFLVFLWVFGRGVWRSASERRLLARLVATEGKELERREGQETETSTDSDGAIVTSATHVWEVRYEYIVADTTYLARATSNGTPPATVKKPSRLASGAGDDGKPLRRLTIYFDPTNPAMSRINTNPDDSGRNLIIFSMVILAVLLFSTLVLYLKSL
jgi:hypothetical protein